jgi:hypothetical protein
MADNSTQSIHTVVPCCATEQSPNILPVASVAGMICKYKIEKNVKGCGYDPFEVLCQHFLEILQNAIKPSVIIANPWVEL